MARKRKLANLIQEEVQRPQSSKVTESESNEVSDSHTELEELTKTKLTEFGSNKLSNLHNHEVTESQGSELPKYLTLVRKETRLRDDQLEQLTSFL